MMKGKLTRHKVGCDKRFRPEQNQAKPLDWEPPAKIPKPPQPPGRPAASLLNAQGQYGRNLNQNFAGVRGAFQQLNQRNIRPAMYSGMPALQFGPRGAGRPPLARPFIPNRQMQAAGIRNNAARLAGNPSVTIQVHRSRLLLHFFDFHDFYFRAFQKLEDSSQIIPVYPLLRFPVALVGVLVPV